MKYAIAIVLLCSPALLSAGGRCPTTNGGRVEFSRAQTAKPAAPSVEVARQSKTITLRDWQRSFLFDQQIL